ncbi:MAG: DEAD/DEAH box helicase [Candidatus Gastranaerophilales bacterium]|nr:DEAD/DEAH box helicase [Candidatus Gastranaerophilales bacterium]
MEKLKFKELSLSEEMLKAIEDMGFEEASPIQASAIPLLLERKDIIGQAQTGTGKTAAFAIPVIENIDEEAKGLQAVVLCPTRELVIQVAEEFNKLLKYKENIAAVPVYGGQQIDRQLKALKKSPQIVIGTPGRTMDHIRRGSIKMSSVKTIILDEADEMLDMGFREDIEIILQDTPEDRQTVMFSATMEKDILQLTKQYQKETVKVDVTSKKMNEPKIQQLYFEVMNKNKPELLARLVDIHNIKLSLVFCNTKSQVNELVEVLKTRGYFADALHGDMNQGQRDNVMRGFKNGTIEILVATDVAGRGIDVNNVEAVFNYDLPRDDEDYVHRIGRTGRAGKSGTAFTFVSGKQVYNLKRIEKLNGFQVQRQDVPSINELEATRVNYYAKKIKETLMQGHISKFVNQVELLMGEDFTSLDIAAVLLKFAIEKGNEGFDTSVNFEEIEKIEDNNRKRSRRPSERNFKRDGGNFRSDAKRSYKSDSDKGFKSDTKRSYKSDNDKGFKSDAKRSYKSDSDKGFKSDAKRSYKSDSDKGFKSDAKRSYKSDSDKGFKSDTKRSYKSDSDKGFKSDAKRSYKSDSDKGFKSDAKRSYKSDSDKGFKSDAKRSYKSDNSKSFKSDSKKSFKSDDKKKSTGKK